MDTVNTDLYPSPQAAARAFLRDHAQIVAEAVGAHAAAYFIGEHLDIVGSTMQLGAGQAAEAADGRLLDALNTDAPEYGGWSAWDIGYGLREIAPTCPIDTYVLYGGLDNKRDPSRD